MRSDRSRVRPPAEVTRRRGVRATRGFADASALAVMVGGAALVLAACGGGDETSRDPLDFTVKNASKGDCLTAAATVVKCDHDKARWRVVEELSRGERPAGLHSDLNITTGSAIAPYCSGTPAATAASWEDTFTIGQNLGRDENSRYTIVCLERLGG